MKDAKSVRHRLYALSVAGVMSALCVLLALTPLGYIKVIPAMSFTIIHIPVIIASIMAGPIAGMTVGLFFGATSLLTAAGDGSILAPFVVNPLVSVLPRVLIGLVSYLVYRGLELVRFIPHSIAAALSGFVGSFTNTIGFFGSMYLIYNEAITRLMNGKGYLATLVLFAPASFMEALGAAIVSLLVVQAISLTSKDKGSRLLHGVGAGE